MAEKKEPRDEKLIEELYERLWWYTYEASEEEFDEKEVDAITRLLDVLEPVYDDPAYEPGADAALKRFWERYGEEEDISGSALETEVPISAEAVSEDEADQELRVKETSVSDTSASERTQWSAGEISADEIPVSMETADGEASGTEAAETIRISAKTGRSRKWRKHLIRLAIGAAACVVLLISVNVGSYALRKKSFFEIVREEMGRTEITVTGNTEEFETNSDDALECSSWEEVKKIVGEDILEPTYIPEGYELKNLTIQNMDTRKILLGRYENDDGDYLKIRVIVYREEFKKDITEYGEGWEVIDDKRLDDTIQFYKKENIFEAIFPEGKCMYYIVTNSNIEVLKMVVDGMAY